MKDKIRKQMIARRNSLSQQQVMDKSNRIIQKLRVLPEYERSRMILFYVSYDKEVFTHSLIKEALEDPLKIVLAPVTDKQNHRLVPRRVEGWDDLKVGAYGILEPSINKKIVEPKDIDMILVPGVAFDKQGNRIGHGLGYYDTLLASSESVLHVGLAYSLQIVDKIPIEKHDLPVDMIITENNIIMPK